MSHLNDGAAGTPAFCQQRPPIDPATIFGLGPKKGGEGGEPQPSPLSITNAQFMNIIFSMVPEGELPVVCTKVGDPTSGGWPAMVAKDIASQCPRDQNNYFNCSTFKPGEDSRVNARNADFSAFYVLVLDDVGTKVDAAKLNGIEPTWQIETSPGNFQLGLILCEPLRDEAEVKALQTGVIVAGLCDPGAGGLNRWARLPEAVNGKEKHFDASGYPFRCRITVWNPEARFTPEQINSALGITPSSPASNRSSDTKSQRTSLPPADVSYEVFRPRELQNPAVSTLKSQGLYKRDLLDGRHEIICPWLEQHTDQIDTGTVYFEPSDIYPIGGFRCQHSHGDDKCISDLLTRLEIDEQQARHRSEIRTTKGAMDQVMKAAEYILAGGGTVYQMGGAIVFLRRDPATGDSAIELANEATLTIALSRLALWLNYDKRSKEWVRCDPPIRIVNMLLKALNYDYLAILKGIARQPYYRPTDGVLVMASGYDSKSGIYGAFEDVDYHLSNLTKADAETALAAIDELLSEFCFESETDKSAAISAMFTAAVRPSLPVAPAFLTTAPDSGVGKSYLNRIITAFAGGEPARASFPKTSEEATKSVVALLLTAPAVIEYDDMDTSFIPHGALNRMLTSEKITERVLGVSKTVTVPTKTFVIASGINIQPERDMLRRVITIRLASRSDEGIGRKFKGRPAEQVASSRIKMIGYILTIIEAWKQAGRPKADVPDIASYGDDWANHCRHPLIWLGLTDPAQCLFTQVENDTHRNALGIFLSEWYKAFGNSSVAVRKIIAKAHGDSSGPLADALLELPIHDSRGVNPSKFGWYLSKQVKRVVGDLRLLEDRADGRKGWRVEKVAKVVPASPPCPAPD